MQNLLILFILASCASVPQNKTSVRQEVNTSFQVETLTSVAGAAQKEEIHPDSLFILDKLNIPNNHFDIPVVYNKEVEKWVKYFTGPGKKWTLKYLNNSTKVSATFAEIIKKESLPQDLIFLSMAESGFRNDITSKAQAAGAWQFMPVTGKQYGLEITYFYDERRHPEKSAQAAARYLKDLFEKFNSWELAMAAYNAGENKIQRAIKKYRTTDFWKLAKGRYLKPETKNYVPKIMALAIIGKNLTHFGFDSLSITPGIETIAVKVPPKTDLIKLALELDVEYQLLQQLNPEFVRWHTPLEYKEYLIKIPLEKAQTFNNLNFSSLLAVDFQISPKINLEKASKIYKVPVDYLKALNPPSETRVYLRLPFHKDHDAGDRMYYDLTIKPRKSQRRFKYVFSQDREIVSNKTSTP